MKKNGKPHNRDLVCKLDDCEFPVLAKMLCKNHYALERYHRMKPEAKRRPTQPMIFKDEAEYFKSPSGLERARPKPVEPAGPCLVAACSSPAARSSVLCPSHNSRRQRWGLSVERLVELQAVEFCQSCGSGADGKTLHFDHDHSHCKAGCSECLRGVLCSRCNTSLGFLQESREMIGGLLAYMDRVGIE